MWGAGVLSGLEHERYFEYTDKGKFWRSPFTYLYRPANSLHRIELDKETSEYLKNNIDLYGYKNCEVLNMDSNKFNKKADFYFYDPPWTGIFYKMQSKMSLYLGGKNIINIMKPNFCLKAPMNYNINELLTKYNNLSIYKIKNYLIIINKN